MAEQRITIRISGRDYVLKVSSPDKEEVIRRAADTINQKVQSYQKTFVGKAEVDILSFVSLNECITSIQTQKQMEELRREVESLQNQLKSYIDNIENSR